MLFAATTAEGTAGTTAQTTQKLFESLQQWLEVRYFGGDWAFYVALLVLLAGTLAVAAAAYAIARFAVGGVLRHLVRRTRTSWDDFLTQRMVFTRVAHLAPAAVLYLSAPLYPGHWLVLLQKVALIYVVIVGVRVCDALLSVLDDIYGTLAISRANPIKGFVQTAKLFVYVLGAVFLLSVLLDKDPWGLVGGIGAVTAVLLLVFKDSILGLVASIQIIVNDLVHIGDWIEMPSRNIDGDVVDITLTTIKVRNFDATVSTIPTYTLISETFKNWRAMTESGGRRIKRAIFIDLNSIKFCDEGMLKRFERFEFLSDYVRTRRQEIEAYNRFDSR